jgi:hypothetical protein
MYLKITKKEASESATLFFPKKRTPVYCMVDFITLNVGYSKHNNEPYK